MTIVLAAISALLYGGADFCGGLATKRSPVISVLVFSQIVGLVLAVGAAAFVARGSASGADLAWGAAAGVCGALGLAALYTALATTIVAVASPIAAVIGAVVPMAIGVTAGERPGLIAWVGIALAVPAIALLASGPAADRSDGKLRRAVTLGAAAGMGFGLFFAAISRTSPGSGLWPLVAARTSTIVLVVLFALVRGKPLGVPPSNLPVVVASGLFDMSANVAFLLASRSGLLTVAAVITSLYPGPTVLLAWVFLRERLYPGRIAGIFLALAGVALLSVPAR